MYLKFKMLHSQNYDFNNWIIRKVNTIEIVKTSAFCHNDLFEFTLMDTTMSEYYRMLEDIIPIPDNKKKEREENSVYHQPYYMGLFKTLESINKELKNIENCLKNNIHFYQINTYEYWKDNEVERKLAKKYSESIDTKYMSTYD